jgi:hypothetical protein
MVAKLCLRTRLSPQVLLDLDPIMFRTLIEVLVDEAKEIEDGNRGTKRHRVTKSLT